jgi:hypothetical protein
MRLVGNTVRRLEHRKHYVFIAVSLEFYYKEEKKVKQLYKFIFDLDKCGAEYLS